jgi:hypothetical protein
MMFDLETVRVFAFMLAAPTIEMMRDRLRLDWPIQDGEPAPVKLTAMLFAPYGEPVTRNELLPRLEDFNAWSGRQIDVVWAGYGRYWGIFSPSDTVEVLEAGDEEAPWLYSPSFFNAFRAQIEADSRWRYGNRIDLLLTNASFDRRPSRSALNSAVSSRSTSSRRNRIARSYPSRPFSVICSALPSAAGEWTQ